MDRTHQLEAIEKLISYSGLGNAKARDLLEKCNWNVDAAYRLYKKQQMEQAGFKHTVTAQSNRFSEPVQYGSGSRQEGVFARPSTQFYGQYGTVTTGNGPAVGVLYNQGYQQSSSIPKFPVEQPRERIIPIQVERRPVGREQPVRQPFFSVPNNVPLQVKTKPNMTYKPMVQPSEITVVDDNSQTNPKQNNTVHTNAPSSHSTTKKKQTDDDLLVEIDDQPAHLPSMKSQQNKDSLENSPQKCLKRGISKISQNAMLVDFERQNVMHDIKEDCHDNMYIQTFILPDVTGYSEDFRAFLERDLIELSTLVSLEQAGRLNWWAEIGVCQRLLPIATSGDGNCLLHAASLAMWGIHDRQLMLRKALYDTLTKKYYRQALYRRWRLQQTQANKMAGLIFSEEEWKQEWDNVLRLASSTPRLLPGTTIQRKNSCCESMVTQSTTSSEQIDPNSPVVYESLEEFHVFVLAHVIQRPIIVVADTVLKDVSGDALAPIPFGGIFLPLECDASHCYRSPLLLTYDAAHFSALSPMDVKDEEKNNLPVAIPIVNPDLDFLPLHFCIDPGINFSWDKNNANITLPDESKLNLMKRYMDLEKLPICAAYLDSYSDDRNSTGSYESDDGLIEKGKKKDGKMSNQLHSVSKQFGSFGKSVGKKIKNLGKGNKEEKKGTRKLSLTQSTKRPLMISALSDLEQSSLWCCKLLLKKSETHQKMIDNYLFDAGERFKKDMSTIKLRNNEIVSRAQKSSNVSQKQSVPCVTNGCHMFGTVDTSYLCSKCYENQKKQLIIQEKDLLKNFACKAKVTDDSTKVGQKSKFYDMKLDKNTAVSQPSHVNVSDKNHALRSPKPTLFDVKTRERTPSPDYDNVDYPINSTCVAIPNNLLENLQNPVSPRLQPNKHETKLDGQPCKNPTCNFYGSEEMDFYCSGCYKNSLKMADLQHV